MRRLLILALILGSVGWLFTVRSERSLRHGPRHDTTWSTWPEAPLPPRPPSPPKRNSNAAGRMRLSINSSGVHVTTGEDVIRVSNEGRPSVEFAPSRETAEVSSANRSAAATRSTLRELSGDWMSGEISAVTNLRSKVKGAVSEWLVETGVPPGWRIPESLVDAMIMAKPRIETEARDYAPDDQMYRAVAGVDFAAQHKQALVDEYHREISAQRLGILGGGLGLVLVCLGIVAGYIRADEATKGYYTNRLRLLAAAGFGATGVVLYQWIMRG